MSHPYPLPKLDKLIALRDAVEKLIADCTRSLHPRVAAGLALLVNLQLRAVKTTDLERRLAKVEKLLARAEAEDDLITRSGASSNNLLPGRAML